MSITRRALIGGALAAAAMSAPACAASLEAVRAKGVLRVSLYQDFQPWSWRAAGVLTGIDVDLGAAFARELGVEVDYFDFTAGEDVGDDLRDTVWRGPLIGGRVADVMMHVPFDPRFSATQQQVAIVAPYYRESFALACDRAKLDCELPPPQFQGHPLAAELDSVPDFYLMGVSGGLLRSDVKHLPSGMAALNAVKAGEAEAAMATRAQVEHAMSLGGGRLVMRKGPLPAMTSPGWDVGVAVKEDSRDLGERLAASVRSMARDGRLAAIFARYGVTPRPPLAA